MALITHRIHCQVLYFDDKNNVAKLNTLEAHVDVKTTQFGFVKQAIILQLCVRRATPQIAITGMSSSWRLVYDYFWVHK